MNKNCYRTYLMFFFSFPMWFTLQPCDHVNIWRVKSGQTAIQLRQRAWVDNVRHCLGLSTGTQVRVCYWRHLFLQAPQCPCAVRTCVHLGPMLDCWQESTWWHSLFRCSSHSSAILSQQTCHRSIVVFTKWRWRSSPTLDRGSRPSSVRSCRIGLIFGLGWSVRSTDRTSRLRRRQLSLRPPTSHGRHHQQPPPSNSKWISVILRRSSRRHASRHFCISEWWTLGRVCG